MNELIKHHSFGEKKNQLVINEDIIEYQGIIIKRDEITGIKYWISANIFYKFSIGTTYYIGIQSKKEQIDFVFTGYLGISDNYFQNVCEQIIDEIWEPVLVQIWNHQVDLLLSGHVITVGPCQLNSEGIFLRKDQLIHKQKLFIPWKDLKYEKKYDRLVINSTSDSAVYKNLYYKDCWNIETLLSLLHWITEENGLTEIKKIKP